MSAHPCLHSFAAWCFSARCNIANYCVLACASSSGIYLVHDHDFDRSWSGALSAELFLQHRATCARSDVAELRNYGARAPYSAALHQQPLDPPAQSLFSSIFGALLDMSHPSPAALSAPLTSLFPLLSCTLLLRRGPGHAYDASASGSPASTPFRRSRRSRPSCTSS